MLKITKRTKEVTRKFVARKKRVNSKIKSSFPEYRIVVDKSNMFVKAQVIGVDGKVICHISDKGLNGANKTERAMKAGEALATLMKKQSIKKATFDRNGHLYHGRVKALAEGIRSGGIIL